MNTSKTRAWKPIILVGVVVVLLTSVVLQACGDPYAGTWKGDGMFVTIQKSDGAYVISDASGQGRNLPEIPAAMQDSKLVVNARDGTTYTFERRGDELIVQAGGQTLDELTRQ